jgi:hypothetical protein
MNPSDASIRQKSDLDLVAIRHNFGKKRDGSGIEGDFEEFGMIVGLGEFRSYN